MNECAFVIGPGRTGAVVATLPPKGFIAWRVIRRARLRKADPIRAVAVFWQPVRVNDRRRRQILPENFDPIVPADLRNAGAQAVSRRPEWVIHQHVFAVSHGQRISSAARRVPWSSAMPYCEAQLSPERTFDRVAAGYPSGYAFDSRASTLGVAATRIPPDPEFSAQWREWLSASAASGAMDLPKEASGEAWIDQMVTALDESARDLAEALSPSLDPLILRAARAGDGIDLALYAFLHASQWLRVPDAARLERRIQAARAMRTYLHEIVGPSEASGTDYPGAVDRGAPLIPLLANEYSVPNEVIRWGRRVTEIAFPATVQGFHQVLRIMSGVPPEKRPETPEDWRVYRALVDEARRCRRALAQYEYPDVLYDSAFAKLLVRLARPKFADARRSWERRCASTGGFEVLPDAVMGVESVLGLNAASWAREISSELGGLSPVQFWQTLLENGLANVQAFNEAWHRGLLKYAYAGLGIEELNLSWPAMMPDWQSDGYTIRCLNDTASVIAEGRAMSHCVANYVDSCWIGDTQIFSLRDPEGSPISTIEIGLRDADRGAYAVLIQHRAASNRQPPEWAVALVERWFGSAVRTIPRDQLAALRAERRRGRDQSAPTAEVQGRKMSFERLVFALRYAWPGVLRERLGGITERSERRAD